jgi:phosphoglycolate phosphatase/putative hydrolase of the HAD superfamily
MTKPRKGEAPEPALSFGAFPKAIIFDVDGTLYSKNKLRTFMFVEFIKFLTANPKHFYDLKIIWDFRRMRNTLSSFQGADLENYQYRLGAQWSRVSPEKVRQVIDKWIYKKPLRYLATCRYQGISELFSKVKESGIAIGIFSDYPAQDKLKSLQLPSDVIVCATDSEVNRLKPDPQGLRVTAMKLQKPVASCLFIGDRDEKDGECARRAGMPYFILNRQDITRQFVHLYKWLEKC